ncbi:MAG: hypothetical protein ABSE86_30590 [Bryobacteraceae bacterium]
MASDPAVPEKAGRHRRVDEWHIAHQRHAAAVTDDKTAVERCAVLLLDQGQPRRGKKTVTDLPMIGRYELRRPAETEILFEIADHEVLCVGNEKQQMLARAEDGLRR